MKLQEEFEVGREVASVWSFFEQPEAVAQCVPGVEQLSVVTPDDIDVRLTQSVGPMTATFAAKVKVVERIPEKLIGFTATGKSVRGAMGNVRATINVQLESIGDRTLVIVDGEVALAGALGSVGQKVVTKQVAKVTAQFARNLEAALGGNVPEQAMAAGSTTAESPQAIAPPVDIPPFSEPPATDETWAKVAAMLSAVSVVVSVIGLRRGSRKGRRR